MNFKGDFFLGHRVHVIDRNKTKNIILSNKIFTLFTWSSFFLVILIFFFSETKFSETKIDFFSDTKFSETETCFSRPNFPKPRLFSKTKFFETKTETLKNWQKFRDRN